LAVAKPSDLVGQKKDIGRERQKKLRQEILHLLKDRATVAT
jgi:hypothetical protein